MADTEDDDKPKTLAEFLGTPDLPREAPIDYEHLSGQEFAKLIVSSFEFRSYIKTGLYEGNIPAAVVTNLMNRAWGKEPDRVEFEDKTKTLESLPREELQKRIAAVTALLALQDA